MFGQGCLHDVEGGPVVVTMNYEELSIATTYIHMFGCPFGPIVVTSALYIKVSVLQWLFSGHIIPTRAFFLYLRCGPTYQYRFNTGCTAKGNHPFSYK